jgi:formylglycine-generating enzyme required for sulfatase activity
MTPVPESISVCPEAMVHVKGLYCTGLAHQCKRYIDQKKDRCGEFLPVSRCLGKDQPLEFCIDRFEYPNQLGRKPTLGMNFDDAVEMCRREDKRLCRAEEWTLACEGSGRLPYPYGYSRDSETCNIDKPYRFPDDQRFADPKTRAEEISRLDQREPSGSREACVSGYGVFDLTGNADEWVRLERGSHEKAPFKSALKGGYWGPVRNRCRPITATHNRWHSGYQIGLRCCSDVHAPSTSAPEEGLP